MHVSTNRVYRLHLSGGGTAVAKVTSYGSYVHFRQDHERLNHFARALAGSRFEGFLAPVLGRGDAPFFHRDGHVWVAFYGDVEVRDSLPPILDEASIGNLAYEIAAFHRATAEVAGQVHPTWKSLGSDVATLRDALERRSWCELREIGPASADFLREHCDAFLSNVDAGPYYGWPRLPVLVDWNIGNFSVVPADGGFRLFSRWDYDWFRIEPRTLDFYFLARVVSSVGDRTTFTYDANPLFEPRFAAFLRAYHAENPLDPAELRFLKEVYRFFLLNYVVKDGEHFFRDDLCTKLRRDVIELHLPALASLDFDALPDVLSG